MDPVFINQTITKRTRQSRAIEEDMPLGGLRLYIHFCLVVVDQPTFPIMPSDYHVRRKSQGLSGRSYMP